MGHSLKPGVVTGEEYKKVVKRAKEMGLTNLDIQGYQWLQK